MGFMNGFMMKMENLKSNFKKKVLKNGVTVLFEKRDVPVVSVGVAVRFGGIHETLENRGVAHFIEHMLFKGSKKYPSAKLVAEAIERRGGDLNGFTDDEITAYICKMPSQHVNVALDVLCDAVKNPLFKSEEVEKERQVIFEEMKLNKDMPTRHVFKEIEKTLFEEPFGHGSMNLGTVETLNKMDAKFLKKEFAKVYTPNNLVVCIVGNADFNEIVKFVEGNFDKSSSKINEPILKIKNEEKIEKRPNLEQANLVLAYHVPVEGDKLSVASKVLISILGEGMSSRLFSEIREKRNLAYSVKGGYTIKKDLAYCYVYAGVSGENVEKVKELILKEFEKVSESLESDELEAVKEQIVGNYYISMEDSFEQMANLLYSEMNSDGSSFYDFEKNVREVKLEDVKSLAKKASENFSFFALVPESKLQ